MRFRRLSALALLAWTIAALPAGAESYLVDGPEGCIATGGEWLPSGMTCLVHRLVLGADDHLVVDAAVGFASDGPAFNYGHMEVRGSFRPNGDFNNRGTLITGGLTVNGAPIYNSGTFINRGYLHNHSGIVNDGVFGNEGFFETCSGAVVNDGYMYNAGDIDNWGGLIVNHYILVNDARMFNPDDTFYRIENTGAVENRGTIDNLGVMSGACGAAFYGEGSVQGNPVEYAPCDPALALQALTSRVFDSALPGSSLSKNDIKKLTGYLGRANKSLAFGNLDGAVAELRHFNDEVERLLTSNRVVRYLGAAFMGWGDRLIDLLSY